MVVTGVVGVVLTIVEVVVLTMFEDVALSVGVVLTVVEDAVLTEPSCLLLVRRSLPVEVLV